jgi:hypothetical protein
VQCRCICCAHLQVAFWHHVCKCIGAYILQQLGPSCFCRVRHWGGQHKAGALAIPYTALHLHACRHIVVSQTTSLRDAIAVVKRDLPDIRVVGRGPELPDGVMRLLPKLVQPLTGHDLGVLR